jgi:uncharacterized protein (DUF58 family)
MPLSLRERLDPMRFLHGEKPSEQPVRLSHRRIFILPTRRGLGFAGLLLLQLLVSINYNNNLGFLLTFLLASVAMVSTLHGYRNLAGLRIRGGQSAPVFAGEAAGFKLYVENPSSLERWSISLRVSGATAVQQDIAAGATVCAALFIKSERRGWQHLPVVTVSSCFPLGLFRAWSPIRLIYRVLVYPQPAANVLPFPSSASATTPVGTGHPSSEDFYGFRVYQPGDSPRQIYWKGLAKAQALQTKQYRGDEIAEIILCWEQTPGAEPEAKLGQLCRWVIDAERGGLRYGLRIPGHNLPADAGAAHCRQCLEALALFEP